MSKKRWALWTAAFLLFAFACRFLQPSSSQNGSVTITQVTPLAQTVYYNQATCGVTTFLVDIRVQSGSQPAQVGIQYRYVGSQKGDWAQVSGTKVDSDLYRVSLPMDATQAQKVGATGLEYRAYAVDNNGKMSFYPARGTQQVALQNCQQQGVSTAQDKEAPRVFNVVTSDASVYYQGSCGPTSLTVTALVVDNSGQAQVTLEYWFAVNMSPVGQVYKVPMRAQGTLYTAKLSVAQQAAKELKGKRGQLAYRVVATDAAGNTVTYPSGANMAGAVEVMPCQQAGPGASGSGVLKIRDVRTNPADASYFGVCPGGETTWVKIEVEVTDINRVKEAKVRYRYELSSAPGNDFPKTASMARQQGIGNYVAHIDVGKELPNHAAVDRLVYYVEITTTDGRTVKSPTYVHTIKPCSGQANQGGTSSPSVQQVDVQPIPVYYGLCASQSTEFQVTAEISSPDQVKQAYVVFGYVPQPNMVPSDSFQVGMGYVGGTTYRVQIDLNNYLFTASGYPPSGYLAINVVAEGKDGSTYSGSGGYIEARACEVTQVNPGGSGSGGSGGSGGDAFVPIPDGVCDLSVPNDPDCGSLDIEVPDGICDLNNPNDPDCGTSGGDDGSLLPPIEDGVCDLSVPNDPDCGSLTLEVPDGICDLNNPNDPDCSVSTGPAQIDLFTAPSQVYEGDPYTVEWQTSNAACVFLDGQQVAASGSQTFWAPQTDQTTSVSHSLTVYGGSCSNPTNQESATVIITVEPLAQPVAP